MEIKAKQLDSVNASAHIKIPSQELKNEVQNLAKKASKTLKIDGFRPGHVPVAVILKRYEKQLQNDAEQNLLKNALNNALKELKKDSKELVGEPYFEKFDKKDEEIDIEFILSFKPDLKLDDYEKYIPQYSEPKATKKEMDEKRKELLKAHASLEPIKGKRALKEGDFAKFDFEGFIDGKSFEGGKANDYVLEIGSKQFIPGFEEGMIGLKIGEEKDLNLSFPKEYPAQHLAGKEVVFKVKLHEIEELKIPELNEELLKKILPNEKEPNAELLEEKIEEQIKNEKLLKLVDEELKAKFADTLIENYNFDLPKGIVEQETDMQFRSAWQNFSEEERKELSQNREKAKEKRDSFKEEAQKSVKLTFIIDGLAKLRKIDINDQELIQAIYFEAYRNGINPKEHFENYKRQGALPAVKMALIEQKLFNDIFFFSKTNKKGEK